MTDLSPLWTPTALAAPPQRIQLRRTKGWRMPGNTISVARPTRWGNPFRVGWQATPTGFRAVTAEEVVAAYRKWLAWYIYLDCTVENEIKQMKGKNLACWCPLDQPCHADVLLEIANG